MNYALATLTDDNYILGTKILIYSFLKYNPWFTGDIVIIFDKLNNLYQEDLLRLYPRIKFLVVNPVVYKPINVAYRINRTRFTNVFYKYEIFNLKNYDRVLFIDSDFLVCKSFETLFLYNYNGCIGLAPDYIFIKPEKFEITPNLINDAFDGWYYGGGFIMLDSLILKNYSTEDMIKLALEKIVDRRKAKYIGKHLFGNLPELDILNVVFEGKILPIDIKYNFYLNTFSFKEAKDCLIGLDELFGIHYVTKNKPWNSDWPQYKVFTSLWAKHHAEYLNQYPLDSEHLPKPLNTIS